MLRTFYLFEDFGNVVQVDTRLGIPQITGDHTESCSTLCDWDDCQAATDRLIDRFFERFSGSFGQALEFGQYIIIECERRPHGSDANRET